MTVTTKLIEIVKIKTITAIFKAPSNWAEAGYEIAKEQFALSSRQPLLSVDISSMSDIQVTEQGNI